ncbi:MAG TPA: polysaccharide biosynthesis protein, partial [Candidatus Limnocylindria bacterium]|nr:polysaccharide biosynthesis protein [Candidatus Limnocylindria bacterium]
QFGFRTDEIRVETIGARQGEKLHEVLLTDDESNRAEAVDGMLIVRPDAGGGAPIVGGRADETLLDAAAIRELLDRAGWLRPESLPTLG